MKRIVYVLIPFLLGTIVGALGGVLILTTSTRIIPEPDGVSIDPEQVKIDAATLLRFQFNRKLNEIKGMIASDCAEFEERGHGECDVEKLGEILNALDRAMVADEEIISWLGLQE